MVCSRFVHWNIFWGTKNSSSMASPWKPFFGTFIFESVLWCFCVPFEVSKLQSLFIVISYKAATRTLYKKPCLCPVEENKSYSFTMTRGWVKWCTFSGWTIKVTVPFHIIYTSNAKACLTLWKRLFFTEQSLTLHVTRLVRVGSDVQLSTLSSTDHAFVARRTRSWGHAEPCHSCHSCYAIINSQHASGQIFMEINVITKT